MSQTNNPLHNVTSYLLNSPWFVGLVGVVIVIYFLALLYKLLRSDEGFLLGYGRWVIGKWQAAVGGEKQGPDQKSESKQQSEAEERPARLVFEPQRKQERLALERELQIKSNVIKLSRLLDGDLAFLMLDVSGEGEQKIMRALQTLVSGVTRVVCSVGRCRCGFFIIDEDEQHLVLVAGEGFVGPRTPRLALENSCAGRSYLTGEKYYCRDTATDPVYWHSARNDHAFRSIACVPVRVGKDIYGVICLDAEQPGAFTAEDFNYLEVFATKVALFCAFHSLQQSLQAGVRYGHRSEGGERGWQ